MTINTVIIDIETLDTKPTAIILSIGAFAFDRFNLNETLETIEMVMVEISGCYSDHHLCMSCDLTDQLFYSNRTVSNETLEWWRSQVDKKNISLEPGYSHLEEALKKLISKINEWKKINPDIAFYFRGTNFDPIILENAFNEYSLQTPWLYYQVRDVRTYIDALTRTAKGKIENYTSSFNFLKHNALHDAMSDAEQMCLVSK
ncbi:MULTISPECIES: 3'-5' exonuclease [unclassified Gilliamella]|uniref:3'-5' exonuclease n=1 Tax=unclassified Gilliamella TaxID=2685620 RepID=UPI001307A527|nr:MULTISPECIES: 3'-5' exonuclease [unclassified Gilliamella]MWP48585.1 3'-5' exoribonuclease [Gilliamella sp. Lep-s35]MWP68647.1 3'-5' exoribonuclease [Gilliamella sp. Lep-s5]MWP76685.1 3'-5' exoribonuclease [Gilliamella sp. Lep-s21]